MKIKHLFVLCCFSLILAPIYVGQIWAQAPTTAKIAFASNRGGNWDIYIMNPDGSEQKRVTQSSAGDYSPVWSPNGEQILFVSNREGVYDLYVIDADGRRVRRVFRKLVLRIQPTWSSDGERIAFHTQKPQWKPEWNIQTATIYGADVQDVAEVVQQGGYPSWSPDGNEIAFVDYVNDARRIRIITLDSGKVRTFLPKESPWMATPAWSPDGNRLAFNWYKWGIAGRPPAIFVANRDGSGLKRVVKSQWRVFGPAWSPEGDKLAYIEQGDNDSFQIFVVDIRTGVRKQLTDEGLNTSPAWFDPKSLSVAPRPHLLTTTWGKIKNQN
ncbi:PD40 domain-containing protein [Candidatus Poribacteria bacterium]|nr:PD40 domain-containing protein [Candidatus Poribacteria bacterium]